MIPRGRQKGLAIAYAHAQTYTDWYVHTYKYMHTCIRYIEREGRTYNYIHKYGSQQTV